MPGVSVEVRNVSKVYGPLTVMSDLSLKVEPGEFIALLGPSGSGKSTLLMSIAGFTQPNSGQIFIDDRDVTAVEPRLRNIGMVFQKYALFPHMTVRQNIAFPLLQRGYPKGDIEQRILSIVALVGLKGLENRPVPNLSGGQQQRVALARALAFQPPVLLMDEPLGALDKKMREHLQVEIKDIQRVTGTTVVFVTHDQTEALAMADRLVVLNHGKIEQIGTPRQLYERPENAFVADFIGEANFVDGRVERILAERFCEMRGADGILLSGQLAPKTDLGTGQTARFMLRPDRINLVEPTDTAQLTGEVISSSFFGENTAIRVRISNGQVLTIKDSRNPTVTAGETVGVSWAPKHAMIFAG